MAPESNEIHVWKVRHVNNVFKQQRVNEIFRQISSGHFVVLFLPWPKPSSPSSIFDQFFYQKNWTFSSVTGAATTLNKECPNRKIMPKKYQNNWTHWTQEAIFMSPFLVARQMKTFHQQGESKFRFRHHCTFCYTFYRPEKHCVRLNSW